MDQYISEISSGLIRLGVTQSSTPIASRPRASIYADTSLNWQLMSQGFARLGCPITTAYTTLGEEGLLTSLEEPEVEIIFCGENQIGLVAKVVERAERIKWVIYDGEQRVDQVRQIPARVVSMLTRTVTRPWCSGYEASWSRVKARF
jgi:long-chain acyl-CoA synthetase